MPALSSQLLITETCLTGIWVNHTILRMAQKPSPKRPSRKSNKISAPENGDTSTQFNHPDVIAKIAEARADKKREHEGDRVKLENAFNDAERLHFVRTEMHFNTEQLDRFAIDCGRPRSTAADLLKIHGHREDGMQWLEARLTLAGSKRVNVSWQAFARDRKLIVRASAQKRKAPNAADKDKQIARLTKERDGLKAKIAEVERQRDDALDRLRSRDGGDT
jgi:hypothetical protein